MKSLIATLFITSLLIGCGAKSKKQDAAKADAGAQTEVAATGDLKATSTSTSTSTADGDKVSCTMKSDTRTIQLRKNGGGCELVYSKFGNDEVIATSMAGTEHCQKVADRIKGNLENSGFKCQ